MSPVSRLALTFSCLCLALLPACNCGFVSPVGTFDSGDDDGGGGGAGGGSGGGGANDGGNLPGDGGCVPCYTAGSGVPGAGVCRAGLSCGGGACVGEIGPSTESCNDLDDDCNGTVDDLSVLGSVSCGLGACKVTVAACTNGAPTACNAGAPGTETCNGIDDNCDGTIDEGCDCVHVAPSGLDSNPGTGLFPKRTLNAAIAAAAGGSLTSSDGGVISTVCAASGAICPSTADYQEAVVMKNGVSVYGGYQAVSINWSRNATCVTRITAQDSKGVLFDNTVVSPTAIDGFDLRARNDPTNAAVTVTGSTGAVINGNQITGNGGVTSYGIEVTDSSGTGATPTITRNVIVGGTGSTVSAGIHSLNSAPTIQLNCDTVDNQGRCTNGCFSVSTSPRSIRGRLTGNGGNSYGVQLVNSPGATVAQNSICAGAATQDSAGVRLTGDGNQVVVRSNNIVGNGGAVNAVGFLADPCNGASPWLFDNFAVQASSATLGARADGVRAVGACHVRIDSNLSIVGGQESSANDAIGIYCARDLDAGVSSQCTVLNNTLVRGSSVGIPPTATGVRCDDGACARIEKNRITGFRGQAATGLWLGKTGTVVAQNLIEGGCGYQTAYGVVSQDSFARLENNVIVGFQTVVGGVCAGSLQSSRAVWLSSGPSANEVELHSNDLFANGRGAACSSRALVLDVSDAGAPSSPRGVVRNNIMHPGFCSNASVVEEATTSADPRVFENNDLWADAGTPLYLDEVVTPWGTSAEVNGMTDITVAANLSSDPSFVSDGGIHLTQGSVCRNAGTAASAPVDDIEGDSRPQESLPDIGADEFVP